MSSSNDINKKQSKQDEKEKRRRRKRTLKIVRRWVGWFVVALFTLLFIVLSLYWFPAELHYKFTETYAFTSDEAAAVNLAVLLPTSGPYQTVTEPQISWPGNWDTQLDGRLNVVRLSSKIGAGETVKAVISYKVNLFQGPARWIGEPVVSSDLLPSQSIQSDSPELAAQAAALEIENNDQATIRNIFNWTNKYLNHLQGSGAGVDQNALDAFTTGTAGSAGVANLFAALGRAVDIPIRTVTGQVIPDLIPLLPITRTQDAPLAFQAWNEVFVQDDWQMVDVYRSGSFLRHNLLGWSDGRHLVYDETGNADAVFQGLVTEAEDQSVWRTTGTDLMKYVTWSDSEAGSLSVAPTLSIQKTWDGRWVMMISLLLILFVFIWLTREDRYGIKAKSSNSSHEK